MGAEYPCMTIVDIARIPEEAFERFHAEFPVMVRTVRGLIEMYTVLHAEGAIPSADDAAILEAMKGGLWVDDDLGNVTANVAGKSEDGVETPLFSINANHKTGAYSVDLPGEPA